MPLKVRSGYGPQVRRQFVPGIYLQPNIPEGAFGGQIGQALKKLGVALEAKKQKDSAFEVDKILLDARTDAALTLPKDMVAAEPGAAGFTEAQLTGYKEKHASIIAGMKERGIAPEQIQEAELALGELELKIASEATGFELKAHTSKMVSDAEDTRDNLAQVAEAMPDETFATVEAFREHVDKLNVDPITREEIFSAGEEAILTAGAVGRVRDDPNGSLEKLDGHRPLPNFLDQESVTQTVGVTAPVKNLMSVAQKYLPAGYTFQVGDRTHGKGGVGGSRTKEQQAEIVKRGDSKTMNSKHIGGFAIDLTPYKDGKAAEDDVSFGIVSLAMQKAAKELGIEMTWGGDWIGFKDQYHFEVDPKSVTIEVPNGDYRSFAGELLRGFEGFRSTPYWDVNANRLGYGTDTVTNPDGSYRSVQEGDVVDKEGADRDLARRIPVFESVIVEQVGEEAWNRLPPHAKAALISVAYNYGALPNGDDVGNRDVVFAVQQGNLALIASEVSELSANRGRRQKEAAVILGQKTSGDPIFDSLGPDTRTKLRTAAEARRDEINTNQIEAFELALLNGEVPNPRAQYQNLYDAGVFLRPEDSRRVLNTIEAQEKDGRDLALGQAAMQGRVRLTPGDTDTKNAMNELGKPLLSLVDQMDNQIVPQMTAMAMRTGNLPGNVISKLVADSQSGNAARALWASRSLAAIADQETQFGPALTSALGDSDLKRLNAFRASQDVLTEERLTEMLRPKTIKEQAGITQVEEFEKDYFEETPPEEFAKEFDGWFGAGTTESMVSSQAYASFFHEYKTLFHDAMLRTENTQLAHDAVKLTMEQNWGYDDYSGKFMKYPPSSPRFHQFFPERDGSRSWMYEQTKADLAAAGYKVEEGDAVVLQPDLTTHREVQSGVKPSWAITIIKANGERQAVIAHRTDIAYPDTWAQEDAIAREEANLKAREEYAKQVKGPDRGAQLVAKPPVNWPKDTFGEAGVTPEQMKLIEELGAETTSPDRKVAIRKQLQEEKLGKRGNLYDWMMKTFSPKATDPGAKTSRNPRGK